MRRTSIAPVVVAIVVSVLVAVPASATVGRVSPNGSFKGHDLASWQRIYMTWVLGSADSPVVAGGCGAAIDGVFFLAPAAVPGVTELDCAIPVGMPILVLAGATFSEIPTYGADVAAVLADARATWDLVTGTSVELDGTPVPLDGTYREGGVYSIPIEEGSVEDVQCASLTPPCQIDFEPPGPVTLATVGQFVMLRPLSAGDHHLDVETDIFGTALIVAADVHVG
jgi:hypothetical protein